MCSFHSDADTTETNGPGKDAEMNGGKQAWYLRRFMALAAFQGQGKLLMHSQDKLVLFFSIKRSLGTVDRTTDVHMQCGFVFPDRSGEGKELSSNRGGEVL